MIINQVLLNSFLTAIKNIRLLKSNVVMCIVGVIENNPMVIENIPKVIENTPIINPIGNLIVFFGATLVLKAVWTMASHYFGFGDNFVDNITTTILNNPITQNIKPVISNIEPVISNIEAAPNFIGACFKYKDTILNFSQNLAPKADVFSLTTLSEKQQLIFTFTHDWLSLRILDQNIITRALTYTNLEDLSSFWAGAINEYHIWNDISTMYQEVIVNHTEASKLISLTEDTFFLYLSIFNTDSNAYWEFCTTWSIKTAEILFISINLL